jgi:hypothetical protein
VEGARMGNVRGGIRIKNVLNEFRRSASKSHVSLVSIRMIKGKDNCDYYLESLRLEEISSIRYYKY